MEGRLFLISLWCGVYGLILRLVFRNEDLTQKGWVMMALNGLFWATGAALLGMLLSSYFEKLDDMFVYAALLAVVGLVIGAARGYQKFHDEQTRVALLRDNLEWADTGFSAILLASVVMFFFIQAFKIPSGSMRMTFVEGDHLFVNKYVYGVPVPFTNRKLEPEHKKVLSIPFSSKIFTVFKKVELGDIVIFRFPSDEKDNPHYGKDFIKRVVATEGQRVHIVDKSLYVDGVKQEEPYTQFVDSMMFPGLEDLQKERFQELWASGRYQGNEVRDNFGPVVIPPGHVLVMGDNRDRSFDSRFWGPLPLDEVKGRAWLLYWPPRRIQFVR